MMLYAKCAAVRDAQIVEKERLQRELSEEERCVVFVGVVGCCLDRL